MAWVHILVTVNSFSNDFHPFPYETYQLRQSPRPNSAPEETKVRTPFGSREQFLSLHFSRGTTSGCDSTGDACGLQSG